MSSLLTTIDKKAEHDSYPTPGEIIREEFLNELDITPYRLAKDIGVSPSTVNRLLNGDTSITFDMALRLEAYFGMSAEAWLNLQHHYDLMTWRKYGTPLNIQPARKTVN